MYMDLITVRYTVGVTETLAKYGIGVPTLAWPGHGTHKRFLAQRCSTPSGNEYCSKRLRASACGFCRPSVVSSNGCCAVAVWQIL